MNNEKKIELSLQHYFLFALILFIFIMIYSMIKPYLNSIIMGVLLSFLFIPLNNKFLSITGKRKNLSAFLSSITLAFVVVIPVAFILVSIIFQGINSFQSIYQWFDSGSFSSFADKIDQGLKSIESSFPFISSIIPKTDISHGNIEKQIISFFSGSLKIFVSQGSQILGSTLKIGMSFFLMMVVFFMMIRDQDKNIKNFLHVIPLKLSQEENIIKKTQELFKQVILGNIFTSLAQGVAGGIGFAIAGLPFIFWGAVIALASLIPVVGTALIWVPAATWLFISGRTGMGIFIIIWFILVVGMIDNFLRPLFMKSDGGMGPVMIFFSILGGINLWGLIGLIYGPMTFGVGFILVYIYTLEFSDYLEHQDKS